MFHALGYYNFFCLQGSLDAYQVQHSSALHVMSHLFVSFYTFCFVSITVRKIYYKDVQRSHIPYMQEYTQS